MAKPKDPIRLETLPGRLLMGGWRPRRWAERLRKLSELAEHSYYKTYYANWATAVERLIEAGKVDGEEIYYDV